jgi:hypothetical protein
MARTRKMKMKNRRKTRGGATTELPKTLIDETSDLVTVVRTINDIIKYLNSKSSLPASTAVSNAAVSNAAGVNAARSKDLPTPFNEPYNSIPLSDVVEKINIIIKYISP